MTRGLWVEYSDYDSKEGMGWTGHSRVFGIQHFPRMSSNMPGTVYIREIVNFVVPAIYIDPLIGVVGNRPKTSRASDLGGWRDFVSLNGSRVCDIGSADVGDGG